MPKRKPTELLRKTMCATCPWRKGSPYECLRETLERSALTESNRICHSTGRNAIYGRTGKPEAVCRGARDIQLKVMSKLLGGATDAHWAALRVKLGMNPEKPV